MKLQISSLVWIAFLSGAQGLSSSIGYLNQISTNAPSTYSTPSYPQASPYAATPPAPAPYKSPFADLPASTGLNYLGNLAGGSSMKPGPNYSGVNQKFSARSASSSLPYTAGAAPSAPAPAPAPYTSSFTTAAPAVNSLNYMASLGGGSSMKSGKNYSGVSNKFGPTRSSGASYLDQVATTSTPAYSGSASVAAASTSGPVSVGLNYMASLGGGSAMKSGRNYLGMSRSFRPAASNSYLDKVTSASPVTAISSGPAVSVGLNYMASLGGGSAMKSGKNYLGMSRSFRPAAASNSYLDKVTAVAPVANSYSASSDPSAPVSTGLNYLGGLSGGSAMKSGKNYLGMSRTFRPTASNSYLDKVATVHPAVSVGSSAVSASSAVASSGPVSSGLNYLGGLSGGSAMKSGQNYLGMSRSFKPTASNSYLDKVASVTPAVSSGSLSAATPAAAASSGSVVSSGLNYLGGLSGGSAMKSGKNYLGMSRSFRPVAASNSYLDKVASVAAAPAGATSFASAPSPAPSGPSSSGLNYLGGLSGGSAMKSGKNYLGMSRTFRPAAASNSYLDNVASVTPAVSSGSSVSAASSSSASGPVSSGLNYLGGLSGGSAMKSGKNYLGMSRTFRPTASNSYLDKVATVTPAVSSGSSTVGSSSASGPVSSGLNYLGGLSGGSAMKSGKNYLGMSRSFRPTASNSYLDKVASVTPAVSSASSTVGSSSASGPVSSGLNYLGGLSGGSAMKSGKNYLGMSRTFRATRPSNAYLDNVAAAAPVANNYASSSTSAAAAAGPVSSGLNYLGGLGGGSAMKSGKNYSGVSNKFGQVRSSGNSYLDNVKTMAHATAYPSAPAPAYPSAPTPAYMSSTPAVTATSSTNYMGSLGGGGAMKTGKNYSGVSQKFGPTGSSNSYLDQVKGATMQTSSYTAAAVPAPAPAPYVSSFNTQVNGSNNLNYMGSLGGGNAMKSGNNFAGVGSTFGAVKSSNPYLESVKNGAQQTASTSAYSSASYVDPAPSNGNYLENLGGRGAVSNSYSNMQNSFAAATGKSVPVSAGGYLSSL